jgi:hypothetical protein
MSLVSDIVENGFSCIFTYICCQVGSGAIDHDYPGRPEDMTVKRPAFRLGRSASRAHQTSLMYSFGPGLNQA